MTLNGWVQFLIFFVVLVVCMRPLGIYMARVFTGKVTFLRPAENAIYRLCGVRSDEEQTWQGYALAMLLFSAVS